MLYKSGLNWFVQLLNFFLERFTNNFNIYNFLLHHYTYSKSDIEYFTLYNCLFDKNYNNFNNYVIIQ